ncbi:C40 family peptidase [Bacillus sp. A116_S68]|nr:C40 family peptidase [Bacillus sp. A116_S68]
MEEQYRVGVSVATLWTSPQTPRACDQKVLTSPVDIRGWLKELSQRERRQLSDDYLIQTQVLYGEKVVLLDKQADWFKVAVTEQPSLKHEAGYPGWLPATHVIAESQLKAYHRDRKFAVINQPTAIVYTDDGQRTLEVSYQTTFPLIDSPDKEKELRVLTPHGLRVINKQDAVIYSDLASIPRPNGTDLVKSGEMFLDLPYLWGGISGFGFDCSGFTYTLHKAWGIVIPRDASEQAQQGVSITQTQCQPGDLIFFAKDKGRGAVYHVGIYYGEDRMLHAPSSGKSIEIVAIEETVHRDNFYTIKRFY